jgi:hypothetical protein
MFGRVVFVATLGVIAAVLLILVAGSAARSGAAGRRARSGRGPDGFG